MAVRPGGARPGGPRPVTPIRAPGLPQIRPRQVVQAAPVQVEEDLVEKVEAQVPQSEPEAVQVQPQL